MRNLLIILSFLLPLGAIAQGTTRIYDAPDCNSVRFSMSYDVEFLPSDGAPRLEVTSQHDIFDRFSLSVSGGCLNVIYSSNDPITPRATVRFFYGASLKAIENAGSGDMKAAEIHTGNDFSITTTGSGDMKFNVVRVPTLNLTVKGSGDIEIGKIVAKKLIVMSTGAGDIEVKNISADTAVVNLRGSGDVEFSSGAIAATNVELKGTGDVVVRRICPMVNTNIRGTGRVK